MPSRFVPPASAQPGFLDISPKKIAGGLAVNRLTTRADLEPLLPKEILNAPKLPITLPEHIAKQIPITTPAPYLDIKHMYLPAIELHPKTGVPLKPTGFHIDLNGIIEKSGLVKIEKIVTKPLPYGCYLAKVSVNGSEQKTSTFFPQDFTPNKACKIIQESLNNSIMEPSLKKRGDCIVIEGLSDNRVPIQSLYNIKTGAIHGYFDYATFKANIKL